MRVYGVDPFRSDYRPKEADRCSASENWFRYVVALAQTSLTVIRLRASLKGELVLESPVAAKSYALLKRGVLKGLSIGYDDVKSKVVNGVRRLSELKLWEISLVTFPMNPDGQVTAVKSEEDFAREMRAFCDLLQKCRIGFGSWRTPD
jgi:hypothetical protein